MLISSTGISLGVFGLSRSTASGTITLTCTGAGIGAIPYTVALSTGGSGTYSLRRMSSGPNTLSYNLYADAALTQIWGDGTGGSIRVSGSLNLQAGRPGASVTHTVYGQVPVQPLPAPGIYADAITMTATF